VCCMDGGGTWLPAEPQVKVRADRRPVTGRRRGDGRRRFADPTAIHGRSRRGFTSLLVLGLALHLPWEPVSSPLFFLAIYYYLLLKSQIQTE
jgi:hypothetical protein